MYYNIFLERVYIVIYIYIKDESIISIEMHDIIFMNSQWYTEEDKANQSIITKHALLITTNTTTIPSLLLPTQISYTTPSPLKYVILISLIKMSSTP